MRIQTRLQLTYIFSDFIMLNIGWLLFNVARYYTLPATLLPDSLPLFLCDRQLMLGQWLVPPVMIALYAVSGAYNKAGTLYRSRFDEFLNTAVVSLIGMLGIFFIALLNDNIPERMTNYELMAALFMSFLVPTYAGRYVITAATAAKIRSGRYNVNALIVGASPAFGRKIERIRQSSEMSGLMPVVCVAHGHIADAGTIGGLPVFGNDDIPSLCRRYDIGAVIVLPSDGNVSMGAQLSALYKLNKPLFVSAELMGAGALLPRVAGVANEPLIDITNANIAPSVWNIKRLSDIVVSSLALILLSPVMAAIALAVRSDSNGPAIYRQPRVGYHGKEFDILKFRSMRTDAESDGHPRLSSGTADRRVTRVGRFLRKYRLDELPQFWNVLKGEMSLVGPRPERRYYVDKIIEKEPWYALVQQVRPGITSWGMVKYGYATGVDEMVERCSYDLLYLRNVSMPVDLKILFHTVSTVFKGKGI